MSTERDLLRDYAHERRSRVLLVGDAMRDHQPALQKGNAAPKAFTALSNVLDVLDRADNLGVKRVDVSGLRDAIRKGLT